MTTRRRDVLRQVCGASLAGALTNLSGILALSPLSRAEAAIVPEMVQLRPEIEPIVRLIEHTPREKCIPMVVEQLRRGLPYRQFLAALYLAGIRNVSPQPPGFKFHCVFAIHAAHQLSLDAPVGERLLPLFWSLDAFKASQQRDVEEGDFRLQPVAGKLPSGTRAWAEFHNAMETWDEQRADRAITALVRERGAHEIIAELWRYGARDYRNIGHKAIFVANTWRTLQTIGWQHAEPALRSLVLGLLDYGPKERVNSYAYEDQCYAANSELARKHAARLPSNWVASQPSDKNATEEVLMLVRNGKTTEACVRTAALLAENKAAANHLWDAVHLAAGELMMRRPGIYGIHTVTSVNGLHYGFRVAREDETRLLLLLQGVGWMSQFANFMSDSSDFGDAEITALQSSEQPSDQSRSARLILSELADDPVAAAKQAFGHAERHPEPHVLEQSSKSLIFRKGTDAHDYKYAAAIFEDYRLVSPRWRPHMLATAVYNLRGSSEPDSKLMLRAREAIGQL